MVVCLEQGADLHMAQLMPLPLTVSCFSKIQTDNRPTDQTTTTQDIMITSEQCHTVAASMTVRAYLDNKAGTGLLL